MFFFLIASFETFYMGIIIHSNFKSVAYVGVVISRFDGFLLVFLSPRTTCHRTSLSFILFIEYQPLNFNSLII